MPYEQVPPLRRATRRYGPDDRLLFNGDEVAAGRRLSLQQRPLVVPRAGLLERGGGAQHGGVGEMAADDLQADRQAVAPSRGDADRRLAAEVERLQGRPPAVVADRPALDRAGRVAVDRERQQWRGRRQHEVEALHQAPEFFDDAL